jgi:hypothetical protein
VNDRNLWILCGGLFFFTLVVIGVAIFMPGKEAIYALFAGILGNFSGGLFTYLNIKGHSDKGSAE